MSSNEETQINRGIQAGCTVLVLLTLLMLISAVITTTISLWRWALG